MNPIQRYLKDLFAKECVIGADSDMSGLAKTNLLLQDLVQKKRIPGLAITVLKGGKTLLQQGYGYADLENKMAVDAKETIFRIASVSKPIAATALAHMVADAQIDLDASLYDYVPYYPRKKWDFTLRQLASHTAGIRGYQGVEYGLNEPYTIKEGIDIFKEADLIFEPGRGYLYNSYDWVLVSLAMQEASGIPFEKYVQQKVLGPLGMTNTYAEGRSKPSRGLGDILGDGVSTALDRTKFYTKNRKGFRNAAPVNNFYKLAGGGYLSTSEDIAKLGQAYLDGKILKAEILSQFLTSEELNGRSTYYGLGWEVGKDAKGRPFYGHVGNGVGGYSNFFVYPEERSVFAILVNCTNPNVQTELDLVTDFLLTSPNP